MPAGTLFWMGRGRREQELRVFPREAGAELQGTCLPSLPLGALPFFPLSY